MNILQKIQSLLRAMDDDALAALANRGLLRRAKKDLETVTPEIIEETNKFARLQVDDCEVTIPEVPAEARSNSPAGNIDRYVLIAFLWLRNFSITETETETETTPPEEQAIRLEMLDDATLTAWAGKATFRKVEKTLNANIRCVVETEEPLVIRIPQRNIVCRWIDGGNLDTMIITGPGKNPKEDGLLAVLLYQLEKGIRTLTPQAVEVLETSDGAPRTRLEVLASLGDLLYEMVYLGLTRLSEATRERLQTLAVSAHGVDLPRLERMIQGLADEIHLQTSRNAQGSTSRILVQTARIDALRCALDSRLRPGSAAPASAKVTLQPAKCRRDACGPRGETPLSDLVGEHRSRYHSVGSIDLIGMGARQWRTKSGYIGLSVYFWDDSSKNWATWSDSRPQTTPGFDPVAIFHGEGPWNGCPSPVFASRNLLKLVDAYRNDNGRISARKQTQAIPLPIDDTDAMILPPPVADWENVHRQAARLFRSGLARRDERDEIVFLKAEHWNDAIFDPADQTLYRTLIDQKGNTLALTLSYETDFGRPEAIRHLEKYDPNGNRGVLGLIRSHQGEIIIEPISFFDSNGIHSLSLENGVLSKTSTAFNASTEKPMEEEQAKEPDWSDSLSVNNAVALLLETLLSDLEMLAEAGLGGSTSIRKNTQLDHHAKQLETIGLDTVSKSLRHFLDTPNSNSSFLHICYVVHLTLQSLRHSGF